LTNRSERRQKTGFHGQRSNAKVIRDVHPGPEGTTQSARNHFSIERTGNLEPIRLRHDVIFQNEGYTESQEYEAISIVSWFHTIWWEFIGLKPDGWNLTNSSTGKKVSLEATPSTQPLMKSHPPRSARFLFDYPIDSSVWKPIPKVSRSSSFAHLQWKKEFVNGWQLIEDQPRQKCLMLLWYHSLSCGDFVTIRVANRLAAAFDYQEDSLRGVVS
jgi:hypothetical protein